MCGYLFVFGLSLVFLPFGFGEILLGLLEACWLRISVLMNCLLI